MKFFDLLFSLLLIIGGLNWGFVAWADCDLVAMFCGVGTALAKLVYTLVAFSAVYTIFCWKGIHNRCSCR